eukprot:2692883-Pleurochrysis_carterae.AAC.1
MQSCARACGGDGACAQCGGGASSAHWPAQRRETQKGERRWARGNGCRQEGETGHGRRWWWQTGG